MDILASARKNLGIADFNDIQLAVKGSKAPRLILLSPTGSGKTLAFALRILEPLSEPGHGTRALVLAPTRELVIQIAGVLRAVGTGFHVAELYGGHNFADEQNSLNARPDIVVATPGRLLDHLSRPDDPMPGLIGGIRALVIDEYDKALELGFHNEMSRICSRLRHLRSVVLTSATPLSKMPDFIDMAGAEVFDFSKAKGTENDAPRLKYAALQCPSRDKLDTLVDLLERLRGSKTIVFVNHREAAERIFNRLEREKLPVGLYHGGLDQRDRDRALIMLENDTTPILVATDLAARGIDIADVDNIVHYHLPASPEAWTHRNGRAARAQDAEGQVFVLLGEGESMPAMPSAPRIPVTGLPHPDPAPRGIMATIMFDAGKREKISRGDIAGFLAHNAGIEASHIGRIDVRDHESYAAVPATEAKGVMAAIAGRKIKNRKVRTFLI